MSTKPLDRVRIPSYPLTMPRGIRARPPGAIITTVKLSQETKEVARRIVAELSLKGWESYGIRRDDPPSLYGVVEEGIKLLAARSPGKGKKR